MIGIKLDKDGDYLYVATMHEVQESKIIRRLHSGRIKKITAESEKISTENIKNNLDKEEDKQYPFYRK